MNDFGLYFNLGWNHIISWDALDHLLFITALASVFIFKEWKKVLILVTAFTIGHSLTLALSVLNIVRINSSLVEFLIPLTIVITSIYNLFLNRKTKNIIWNYLIALFFGFIHGLGFANNIRFMLADEQSIGVPLFSFNAGLEAAQLVVVLIILIITQLILSLKISKQYYAITVSAIVMLIAVWMTIERFPMLNNNN